MPAPFPRVFKNTTSKKVNVIGVGEIPAGEQVSVVADQHQPVVLDNYPGVVEITDEPGPKGKGKKS